MKNKFYAWFDIDLSLITHILFNTIFHQIYEPNLSIYGIMNQQITKNTSNISIIFIILSYR